MSSLNGYIIGGVTILCTLFVFWGIMFMIFYKKPSNLQKYISDSYNYSNFPKSKAGWFTLVISIILIVVILSLIIIGVNDSNLGGIGREDTTITNQAIMENFGNNTSATTTYKAIGYGPLIDKTKVRNWLNGTSNIYGINLKPNETIWLDGNDTPIAIPTEKFRALYGYIPPSFSYYPKGQTKNDYNFKNYKTGRENCMKACSLTNCVAVQTEVPENCSQKANVTGNGNSCGNNSEFSCTLFYDNIKNADDGYWTLTNYKEFGSESPGCFENIGLSCLGKKYYEDNAVPTELSNKSIKPSENPITFCESNVTDQGNCIKRPLLTTEYVTKNYPYYTLPINASKMDGSIDNSIIVPAKSYKNGMESLCGLVNGKLVSCESTNVCNSNSENDCWKVDTSKCSGDPYNQSSGATELQKYKDNYENAKGTNYDDLYPSCYYRQKLTVVEPIQFNCDSAIVKRGCYGSPSIIYTDSLTDKNDIAACSDTSVIPSYQRCQNGTDLTSCNGFPYSCGSNNGTNTLWIKN